MKLYEVIYARTVYEQYVVEALDENHAKEEAGKLLEEDQSTHIVHEWEVESVEEARVGARLTKWWEGVNEGEVK